MDRPARTGGLFRAVDCVQLPVRDLDAAIAFYRDRLGHRLLWRTGTAAGGTLLVEPFDLPVGRLAVVADPFGNPLTFLDLSRGRYRTDPDGNVTGVAGADG